MKRSIPFAGRQAIFLFALMFSGCASYTTPGGPVDLAGIQSVEIRELMAREPAASFPALVTFARVQSPDYRTLTSETYGNGAYVVVTNREFLSDDVFENLSNWPAVRGVSPLSRLLIPSQLNDLESLRVAAANLKADILVTMTLDTTFRVDGKSIGPLSVISLGLMRDRETVVSTTASAIFVDVRSGFVYGVAESSATERQTTNAWDTVNAADQGRLNTEREAFDRLLETLGSTWSSIVEAHSGR
ncbi:MAG: hypothetical protein AB8F65_06275 [Woeseiaceae bacterium]